jgi:EAL domain-containing protein (putative c-di-GMP-specific phosphodiesterase class I)
VYRHENRANRGVGAGLEVWPPAEERLLEALTTGALDVQFTPLLDVSTVTVAALDSALQWTRPNGEMISESRLATAIERPGYTRIQRAVTARLLEAASRRAADSTGSSTEVAVVAVNLGRSQFYDATLLPAMRRALDEGAIEPSQLEIGVDEQAVISDLPAATEILNQLSRLGVRTTVRDFGALTGDELRQLNVTGVTIDFWNSRRDERASRYVAETVRTAHGVGIPVTATRAEMPEEVEFARSLQVERLAHGTADARALPANGAIDTEDELHLIAA